MSDMTDAATVTALQDTLAGEHAAVWVFATLAARTSASAQPELYAALSGAYADHRARRDLLLRTVRDADADPVAAAPGYTLPGPAGSPAQVRSTAALVEHRCAATYADLVANSSGDQRAWAIGALRNAAARELALGGSPEDFPGAEELAGR